MPARFSVRWIVSLVLTGVAAVTLSLSMGITGTDRWSPRPAAAAGGAPAQIQIKNFAFDPPVLTISAGQTLVWTNDDVVPHTATADTKAWNSGQVGPGHRYTVTLTKSGTYDYACTIHTFMHAKVVVTK
jgi:plastocyanin